MRVQSLVCPRLWGSRCSRVEHRLFDAAFTRDLPVHLPRKDGKQSLGGRRLTRCWVLRARAKARS